MKTLVAVVALSMMGGAASAQVLWDESVSGDASGDPLHPSNAGVMVLGSNVFAGSVSNVGGSDPRDYITFVVPDGRAITQLILLTLSPDNIVWTHFDDGPTSVIPAPDTAGSLLAGAHIPANTPDGADIFGNYQTGSPELLAGPGFSGPIGPGTYTFLMQQTSPVPTTYGLDFIVVPAPGVVSAAAIGALVLGTRRRR
jgi:hypothetical protein